MARPDRYPTWAAQGLGLPANQFAEPLGGTAGQGYPPGHKPSAANWNWTESYQGRWARHLDETAIRYADIFDTVGALYAVTEPISFTIGGPLTQGLVTGGVYAWNLNRLEFEAGHEFTFAPNLVQFLHARTNPDNETRDPRPDTIVSANAVEPGYIAVHQVTTDATTIVAATDFGTRGTRTNQPWDFGAPVTVNIPTGGVAVDVNYLAGPAGVRIRPAVNGVSTLGLLVDTSHLANDSTGAQFTNSSPNFPAARFSNLDTWAALHAEGDEFAGHFTTAAAGAEAVLVESQGRGIRIDATAGEGITIDSPGSSGMSIDAETYGLQIAAGVGTGPQLIIDPRTDTPGGTPDGSIWHNSTDPILGLRMRTGSTNRVVYKSQDGFAMWWALTPNTNSIFGTELVASVSAFFRQGGIYAVDFQAMHGRSQPITGLTWLAEFDAQIDGITLPNSDHNIAPAQTDGGGSGVAAAAWNYSYVYIHAGPDAFLDVELFATKPGGGPNFYVVNPSVRVLCINS